MTSWRFSTLIEPRSTPLEALELATDDFVEIDGELFDASDALRKFALRFGTRITKEIHSPYLAARLSARVSRMPRDLLERELERLLVT